MNNDTSIWHSSVFGMIGGMWKFIFIGIHASFIVKLFEAGVTAFVCGIVGALGKLLVDLFKERYSKTKI